MNDRLILGQYRPSNSFGHRLDPRGKIFFALFIMLLSIFTTSIYFYLGIIAGVTILLIFSGITAAIILRNLKPFLILALITALYHLIFSARDTEKVMEIFGFALTSGGIEMAVSYSLRVLVFVTIAFFVSLTTAPDELAETLVSWLKPFRRFGIPAEDIGLIVFIAMRFIPVLAEEFDMIRKAQMVRGVTLSGKLRERGRKLLYLLIPVFHSALRRADELAMAIESRGYVSGEPRSAYHIFRFRASDWLFLAAALSSAAVLFFLTGELSRQ
ncbi:MAG: energy-coupling factor transporter transmembrane component T [Candidatus Zixiibacteriota bacterium]